MDNNLSNFIKYCLGYVKLTAIKVDQVDNRGSYIFSNKFKLCYNEYHEY